MGPCQKKSQLSQKKLAPSQKKSLRGFLLAREGIQRLPSDLDNRRSRRMSKIAVRVAGFLDIFTLLLVSATKTKPQQKAHITKDNTNRTEINYPFHLTHEAIKLESKLIYLNYTE